MAGQAEDHGLLGGQVDEKVVGLTCHQTSSRGFCAEGWNEREVKMG